CKDMYAFTVQKTKEIERKVQGLLRIQRLLEELKEKCPDEKAMYTCPIIETLMGGPDK
ncbi:Hg(II)-responsive transcriptional regulator MerR, partial [Staphylococcus aureus]|nr:Hg(II)-responsive transcriptional regulator MerR [Staphylococcus aureus]